MNGYPEHHADVTAEHDRELRNERVRDAFAAYTRNRWGSLLARGVGAACPDCQSWGSHEPWCPSLED